MKKLKTFLVSSSHLKIAAVAIIAAGLLVFRFVQVFGTSTQKEQYIQITGKVNSEPVIFGQSQYFLVGDYRIRTKIYPQYHYGDVLEIFGTPDKKLLISYPTIKKISQDRSLLSPIFDFRKFLISQAEKIWPQPEASLLTGAILGQDTIPKQFREVLINTGTIHIVVVSGQNVAMLAGFITVVFSKLLSRKKTAVVIVITIIFYTLLTGAQPPTIRAAVMGILAFVAKLVGREAVGIWTLATVSFLMLIFNPKFATDISFQLSVAATFGILFAQPAFEKFFEKFPKIINQSQSVTFAAWIFTAPIIAFYFSKFTPITPISNLLVIPTVPFLMIGGAISLVISVINLFLARIFALVPYVFAAYFTLTTEKLAQVPFSNLSLPQINVFLVLSFYLFVILIIKWIQKVFLAKN